MDHFRQAHQELRDTDTSMSELGFQSANAIVEQIVGRLREEENTQSYPPPPGFEGPPRYAPPEQIPPRYDEATVNVPPEQAL